MFYSSLKDLLRIPTGFFVYHKSVSMCINPISIAFILSVDILVNISASTFLSTGLYNKPFFQFLSTTVLLSCSRRKYCYFARFYKRNLL